MSDEKTKTTGINTTAASSSLDFIWPSIAVVIIFKIFGAAGGLITIGAYYWLKPKIGIWGAIAAACILGAIIGMVLLTMLRA